MFSNKKITNKNIVKSFIIMSLLITIPLFLSGCEKKEGLRIKSSSSDLEGQNYETVILKLESVGFTDIKTVILDDLILGWLTKDGEVEEVAINGDTSFDESAYFPADAKIIITYHTFPEKDPVTIEGFPEEDALRAAVVAFTNRYADDVFKEDRSTVDPSMFHSYSDLSGFFLHLDSKGTWTIKNENTWHVEHLKLTVDIYNTKVDANLDVSFDGEFYYITNLTGKAPSYPDISDFENESDFSLYFIVRPDLIVEDRAD